MIATIFANVFTICLIIANIYFFKTQKYLNLFFPCILFLPDYYGFEMSEALPLITVARLMFLVFFIYTFVNKRRNLNLRALKIKDLPKEYLLLVGYFVFRLASNLYYVTTYGQAAKTIMSILFEQLLLLFAIYMLAPTRDEIIDVMRAIVVGATVLFVIGIFESYTSIRPFDALYTITRFALNDHYVRLGLLRATTTLGLPGFYGNMCVYMLPIIFYLYELTGSKKYIVITGLDVLAIIHSGCRSDMIYLVGILGIYFIYVLNGKKRRLLFIKNAVAVTIVLLLFIGGASLASPNLRYFYVGNGKSVLNELGFEFDLNEGAPEGADGFGNGGKGSLSRTAQFSGLRYVAGINPIFGLGSGAQARNAIKYCWYGHWLSASTYDLGIVEIFCDEGIIGTLGLSLIIIFMIISSRKNKYYQLAIFTYLISTLSTANVYEYIMLFIIIFSERIISETHTTV